MLFAATSAAARMNGIYRHQRFIYDATRRYYLLGRAGLIEGLDPPQGARMLEAGCGTAWNLIRAAERYPEARLYGLDISTDMLRTAGRAIDREGLRRRISLAHGDATDFDTQTMFGVAAFERVFVSYALSMIPAWLRVLDAAERVLAPGGEIHLVDFGQSERLPAPFRQLLFAWLARFSVTPRANLEDALSRFAGERGLALEFTRLYCGYAVHAVLRRA